MSTLAAYLEVKICVSNAPYSFDSHHLHCALGLPPEELHNKEHIVRLQGNDVLHVSEHYQGFI